MTSLLIVSALFVTSQNYSQLALAIVLYPMLIFLGFKLFPQGIRIRNKTIQKPPELPQNKIGTAIPKDASTHITDIDKRTMLKLIGATGASFFLFSLLGRRAENMFFAGTAGTVVNTQNNGGSQSGPSPTDGYKISEIDEEGAFTFYGFTDKDGGWLIMREDTDELNYRYAKGSSDFPSNWTNRENIAYDYYHKIS